MRTLQAAKLCKNLGKVSVHRDDVLKTFSCLKWFRISLVFLYNGVAAEFGLEPLGCGGMLEAPARPTALKLGLEIYFCAKRVH